MLRVKKNSTARKYYEKYKHYLLFVAYLMFYLVGFSALESASHRHYHVIHSVIDDMIPFNEYFVIPYYLWFFYIGAGVCWFIFKESQRDYDKLVSALCIGMTVFLIVSCIFPNRLELRPTSFAHHNFCTWLVQKLYKTDTPTNVLPSIHVFNTLIMLYAIRRSTILQKHRWVELGTAVLSVLIILSTMFLKQHSVVDVSCGILMSIAVQMFVDKLFDTRENSLAQRLGQVNE